MAEQIFYFVAGARFLGYKGVGTRGGGGNFFENLAILNKMYTS